MSSEKKNIKKDSTGFGRRSFLAGGLCVVALGSGRSSAFAGPIAPTVVRAGGAQYSQKGEPGRKAIGGALDKALNKLAGPGGWSALFNNGEKVALKLNCLAGPGLSPRRELVDAIIERLKSVGVRDDDIMLFERVDRDLRRAGYKLNTGPGIKIFGHDQLDEGYEPEPTILGSLGSCFSTVLTRYCDKMINVGVLKDHDLAGVSIGLKNLYGVIHNPSKYHDNNCSPYVAEVASHPAIRKKMVLSICDGTIGQYHGGPGNKPAYQWPAETLLIARDPVALDSIGHRMIAEKRALEKMPTLAAEKRYPAWLEHAARLKLGEADPNKISVIEV